MKAIEDHFNRPLRDLRISVTDHCNLRCSYCLPEELFGPDFRFLPQKELLTFEEITRLVQAVLPLGIQKIRLTGGEPLLRPKLWLLIEQLRSLDAGLDLAMTTNGLGLGRLMKPLKLAGLQRINISLDALNPATAKRIAGKQANPQEVWRQVLAARDEGFSVKVNMVVQRNINEHEILPMVNLCRKEGIQLRFIEFMDVGNSNHWNKEKVVFGKEILHIIEKDFSLKKVAPSNTNSVAERYKYEDLPLSVGFINSISQPFCQSCSRMRLSADGRILTCLFSDHGPSIKKWLREELIDGKELQARLTALWGGRKDRYSEERNQLRSIPHKPEMWTVGG